MSTRFSELIERARAGSDSAARELVERYHPHIMRAVRRKIVKDIRPKFDSIDFAQAVWLSFFRNRSQVLKAQSPEQLIGLLSAMARNKVIDELRRRMNTKKYNIRRETSLDSSGADSNQGGASSTTPSQVVVAREKLEQLTRGWPEQYRRVVMLRIDGLTHVEIAARERISTRTVRRIVRRLAARQES